jgi:predicted nucleic acid-binding protein
MKPKVYIETSVISYLTARPANDLMAAAWQSATCEWWETRKMDYELVTSALVREEAAKGDQEAAVRRLAVLKDIPNLKMCDEITELTKVLVLKGALPEKATDDAMHVAFASYHHIDYLLTWNCRHIDNAAKKPLIRQLCANQGWDCPEICTPLELMEGDHA